MEGNLGLEIISGNKTFLRNRVCQLYDKLCQMRDLLAQNGIVYLSEYDEEYLAQIDQVLQFFENRLRSADSVEVLTELNNEWISCENQVMDFISSMLSVYNLYIPPEDTFKAKGVQQIEIYGDKANLQLDCLFYIVQSDQLLSELKSEGLLPADSRHIFINKGDKHEAKDAQEGVLNTNCFLDLCQHFNTEKWNFFNSEDENNVRNIDKSISGFVMIFDDLLGRAIEHILDAKHCIQQKTTVNEKFKKLEKEKKKLESNGMGRIKCQFHPSFDELSQEIDRADALLAEMHKEFTQIKEKGLWEKQNVIHKKGLLDQLILSRRKVLNLYSDIQKKLEKVQAQLQSNVKEQQYKFNFRRDPNSLLFKSNNDQPGKQNDIQLVNANLENKKSNLKKKINVQPQNQPRVNNNVEANKELIDANYEEEEQPYNQNYHPNNSEIIDNNNNQFSNINSNVQNQYQEEEKNNNEEDNYIKDSGAGEEQGQQYYNNNNCNPKKENLLTYELNCHKLPEQQACQDICCKYNCDKCHTPCGCGNMSNANDCCSNPHFNDVCCLNHCNEFAGNHYPPMCSCETSMVGPGVGGYRFQDEMRLRDLIQHNKDMADMKQEHQKFENKYELDQIRREMKQAHLPVNNTPQYPLLHAPFPAPIGGGNDGHNNMTPITMQPFYNGPHTDGQQTNMDQLQQNINCEVNLALDHGIEQFNAMD